MTFLSPILLSISNNLNTLKISNCLGIKKLSCTKSSVLLIAITASIGTFLSMCLGKLIKFFFEPNLAHRFGCVLLGFIGVYFIVEYMRLKQKRSGYDTSFYVESTSKYKEVIDFPENIYAHTSNIELKDLLLISIALVLNSFPVYMAAGIMNIDIGLSILFVFMITILCFYTGCFTHGIWHLDFINKFNNLISGTILIIIGLLSMF